MGKDNKALPTVMIKDKPYVLTQHRLLEFHRLYPNGSIKTEITSDTEDSVVMVTKVTPDVKVPERAFTGIAQETRGSTFINKTSHYENCETSSRARALSNLGIGVEESCASAEEVANAVIQQTEQSTIKSMEEVIVKVNTIFNKHSRWIPIAVECKVCKPNAFENSLKKIFDAKSVHEAKKIVEKIEQALVDYYEELLENEQYKRMLEEEKERKAKESSKKGD